MDDVAVLRDIGMIGEGAQDVDRAAFDIIGLKLAAKGELHPPAPVATAPALLEACGYHRYPRGTVTVAKVKSLATKFHALYGIGCTPAQRITRKEKGLANVVLVVYSHEGAETAEWLLLATDDAGLEGESMRGVEERLRLNWLGYELVRHPTRGRAVWTWRRNRQEMAELHALLAHQTGLRHHAAVAATLERIAQQPGFYGVRTQSWSLCQEARRRGYPGPLPQLLYLQKVSHGERLTLTS